MFSRLLPERSINKRLYNAFDDDRPFTTLHLRSCPSGNAVLGDLEGIGGPVEAPRGPLNSSDMAVILVSDILPVTAGFSYLRIQHVPFDQVATAQSVFKVQLY